jgi:poly(3-hydroxybutyrate) depolymerase
MTIQGSIGRLQGLALLAALLVACGDDDGHAARDAGDAAAVDAAVDAAPDASPPGEPVRMNTPAWVAAVVPGDEDPVYAALEAGTFELPAAGDDYLGLAWEWAAVGESGQIGRARIGLFYVAAEIEVPPGRRVFARADSVHLVFAGPVGRQPGDLYHSRRHRVPLGVSEGPSRIVVRAYAQAATPEIELWSTDGEVVFNLADVTLPDLPAGRTDASWVGVATLNLLDVPLLDVRAEVVDGTAFAGTVVEYPALSAAAVTQVGFRLEPRAAPAGTGSLPARLRLTSPSLAWPYEVTVDVPTVAAGARYRQTRRSGVDRSVQYHAVMPPTAAAPAAGYGLILSLHGAGVEASGQAAAYSPKDWAYLVAPTNRRPFGFDWEEWGRLDALEALDHALAAFPIDPTRVHLTGHSMGGHGSWNLGVLETDRFALIGPSAGWISEDLYQGTAVPTGVIGRARRSRQTLDFAANLAPRSVYIIHGAADDNVPVSHARQMFETLGPLAAELEYHEEPGAGHWWDVDPEEGADCVDWEPMIARMADRYREVTPLAFTFRSPAPWVKSTYGYVTVRSAESPLEDVTLDSTEVLGDVALTTTNVRSLVLDGEALLAAGATSFTVDGALVPVAAGPLYVGAQGGKRPGRSGPLNHAFQRPFCLVYDPAGPEAYRRYAAFLLSEWNLYGNGHGCAVGLPDLPSGLEAEVQLVFLGVAPADLPGSPALPVDWDADGITLNGVTHPSAAVAFVYPAGERLHAYLTATAGSEYLLFRYVPFSSRSGMPDLFVWAEDGLVGAGFFDAEWQIDPAFLEGL